MEIIKVIGVALVSLVIIIIIKQYKPEFALYVSLVAGIIILSMAFTTISEIVDLIKSYADKASISNKFVFSFKERLETKFCFLIFSIRRSWCGKN